MFATATDLPHSKHRECNHDARSSSWSASRVDRDGHDDGESSWPGRRVVLSWGGASPAQLAGCRVLAVTVVTARSVACGTNSVTIASEVGKIRPSLAWLGHPGCYELGAFALAAAATHEITRWQDARTGHKTTTVRFQPSHGGWRNRQIGSN